MLRSLHLSRRVDTIRQSCVDVRLNPIEETQIASFFVKIGELVETIDKEKKRKLLK